MGWDFTQGATRADVIREITETTRPQSDGTFWRTLKHTCIGNVLWAVQEVVDRGVEPERFIRCSLLKGDRGYGWGKKDMSESMGPCEHSCPLAYLDMVPEADKVWRAHVRKYHADRKRAREAATVGAKVILLNRRPAGPFEIISTKPLRGRDLATGIIYRLPRTAVRPADYMEPTPNSDRSLLYDDQLFELDHANDYLVISAFGDWQEGVPSGKVGVVARKGGRTVNGDEKFFLIDKSEYDARDGKFIIDPARHIEVPDFTKAVTKEVVL